MSPSSGIASDDPKVGRRLSGGIYTTISGIPITAVLSIAESVLTCYLAMPECPKEDQKKAGLYLALGRKDPNVKMLLAAEIGTCDPTKAINYFHYSQEKATRILSNVASHHISSAQSRDEGQGHYTGGIAVPENSLGISQAKGLFGGVSGLSEHGDEAVILVIFMVFRWITVSDADCIIDISKNMLFTSLLKACANLF